MLCGGEKDFYHIESLKRIYGICASKYIESAFPTEYMQRSVFMEEFYAWHVVTGRPMALGQHIVFDENHHNGVYHRVMEKLPMVDALYAEPEAWDGQDLEHHLSVALRELAMEEVRRAEYPRFPSRLACLYVSEDPADSRLWARLFQDWERDVQQIVRLRIRGRRFVGDANNCFPGTPNRAQNLEKARNYWQCGPNPNGERPIREMLVDGDIEVVEILESFQGSI